MIEEQGLWYSMSEGWFYYDVGRNMYHRSSNKFYDARPYYKPSNYGTRNTRLSPKILGAWDEE